MEGNTLLRGQVSEAIPSLNGKQSMETTPYASSNPGSDPMGVREEAPSYERDYPFSLNHCPNYQHSFACARGCKEHRNRVHLRRLLFNCPVLACKKSYSNAREMELHLWERHPERGLQPRPFFCQHCGDTFLTEVCLSNHLKSSLHHLDGRPLRELRPAPPRPLQAPQAPENLATSEMTEIAEVLELAELAEWTTAYEQLGTAAYAPEFTEASFIVIPTFAGRHWSGSNDES